ncbi:hypothetical protein [Thalassospira sp.]|uniref:hypothetical protein n=1 Tax=Thalassospira sp. TaxID=1912094 RepID=UPI003AA9D011
MSNESWQTILLIFFGMLLGVIGGLLCAPYLLPIVVGDGWWSVVGAFIGVMGAFLAAWASFVWQESARKKETWRPFLERYDYALTNLRRAQALADANKVVLAELGEQAEKTYAVRPKLGPRISYAKLRGVGAAEHENISGPPVAEIQAEQKLFHTEFDKLELAKEKVNVTDLEQVQKCLIEARSSLDWVREKMQLTLTPVQISSLDGAIEWFGQLQGCIEFAINAISRDESWSKGPKFRGDIINKALVESFSEFSPMIHKVISNLERLPKQ